MADVQVQFESFHEAIKLKRFAENAILREKRDIIRDKLKQRLPEVFEAHGEIYPKILFYDQGSYELGTGTKPLNGDYDIDQGLYFAVSTDEYPDPVVLKERVYEALAGHTKDVKIRRPCVTVFYKRGDDPIYHVDIAIYSDGTKNGDGKSRLAKGRLNSTTTHRIWEISNPREFADTIGARFTGKNGYQFRRIVRYLKRWRDTNFPAEGNAAPLGIGLTVLTYEHLQPDSAYTDLFSGMADDLAGLRSVVRGSLAQFTDVWDETEGRMVRRLTVTLPIEPWSNLFEAMTAKQMEGFEAQLNNLQNALDEAFEAVDPVDACKALSKVFGAAFPIPSKQETAKHHAPAIVSSSNSA